MSPYPLLVALGLVLTWWGWKTGAYFGDVLIPGVIVLSGIVIAMVVRAPWQADVKGPAKVAFAALGGLAAWTLLSFIWTPAKEVAIADAERVIAYVLIFVLGAWLALLLEREMTLAAVPVVVAGAAVGLATTLTIAFGSDTSRYLDLEGLLSYPLGYHNAVAAFSMVCAIPALALITREEFQWPLRSALAASVTIAAGLTILTQSRGAVIAAVFGLLAVILLSRSRLGTLGWTVVALVPAILVTPLLLDVYSAASDGVDGAGDELRRAGGALIVAAAASAAVAALVSRSENRFALPPDLRRRVGTAVVAVAVLAVAVPTVAVVARDGGPASFLDRRIDELSAGTPEASQGGSRIGVNLGSDRGTLWSVALDDVAGAPVNGEGAGGFEYSFLAERESPDDLTSEDPHSVGLLMLSELGIVGFGLFAAFAGGAVMACWRSRRLGPAAAGLSAAALGSSAYWAVHASVDWFWHFPAVTAPVVLLLGGAAAPGLRALDEVRVSGSRKPFIVGGLALTIAVLIPLFLSERLLRDGIRTGSADVSAAYSDLGLAADLNPWSPAPLIAEAEIAEEAGESQRALALLARASERKPDDWTPHFLAARVLAPTDPGLAAEELAEAQALNPQGRRIIEAQAELSRETGRSGP